MRVRARGARRSAQDNRRVSEAPPQLPVGGSISAAPVPELRARAVPRWPRLWRRQALAKGLGIEGTSPLSIRRVSVMFRSWG